MDEEEEYALTYNDACDDMIDDYDELWIQIANLQIEEIKTDGVASGTELFTTD